MLKEIIEEYKKVYWPSKQEVLHVTVIVLLITIFISLYVVAFDLSFDRVLSLLITFLRGK
jgi:preprotein translocase subunit SecE